MAALAGPVLLGVLAGADTDVAVGELVGRFSLVVLVPLAVGLAVRFYRPCWDGRSPSSTGWRRSRWSSWCTRR